MFRFFCVRRLIQQDGGLYRDFELFCIVKACLVKVHLDDRIPVKSIVNI